MGRDIVMTMISTGITRQMAARPGLVIHHHKRKRWPNAVLTPAIHGAPITAKMTMSTTKGHAIPEAALPILVLTIHMQTNRRFRTAHHG